MTVKFGLRLDMTKNSVVDCVPQNDAAHTELHWKHCLHGYLRIGLEIQRSELRLLHFTTHRHTDTTSGGLKSLNTMHSHPSMYM